MLNDMIEGHKTNYILDADIKGFFDNLNHDWILVDGPFLIEKRDLTLQYRGSDNQRVIDLAKTREKIKLDSAILNKAIYAILRIVVIHYKYQINS